MKDYKLWSSADSVNDLCDQRCIFENMSIS